MTRLWVVLASLALVGGCGFAQTPTKVDIVALDYSFDPATIPLDAHTIAISVHNQGDTEHDFELIGPIGGSRYAPSGVVAHVGVIQPGITSGVTVTLKPGNYRFICTVADHAQRGMTGSLTVV